MIENGQMKNELEKLEKKLKKLKKSNKSLWDTYGSELCAGEMIAEEKALEKEISKLKTIIKWDKAGLLEGLDGNFAENIFKLFEAQQKFIIKENNEQSD